MKGSSCAWIWKHTGPPGLGKGWCPGHGTSVRAVSYVGSGWCHSGREQRRSLKVLRAEKRLSVNHLSKVFCLALSAPILVALHSDFSSLIIMAILAFKNLVEIDYDFFFPGHLSFYTNHFFSYNCILVNIYKGKEINIWHQCLHVNHVLLLITIYGHCLLLFFCCWSTWK